MSGTKLSFRELVSLGLKPGDAWGEEKRALEKELDRYDRVAPSYASYGGTQAWDHRQAPVAPQHSRASSAGPGYISSTPSNLAGRTSKSTGRSYTGTYPEPPATRTSYHGPAPTQTSGSSSSRGSTGYPSNGTIPGRTFAAIDSSHRSYNSQPPVRVPGGYYTEPASTHPQHQNSRSSSNQDNVYPVAERPFATLDSKSRSDSPSTYHQPLPQAQAAYGHYHRAGSPSGSVVSTASTSQGYVRHAPSAYAYTQEPHGYANANSESLTTSRSTWSGYRDYSAYSDERSSRSNSIYASSVASTVSPSYTYPPPPSSVYQTYHLYADSGADDDALNAIAAYSSSGSGLGQYTAEDFGEVERCSGYVHVEYLDEEDEDGHDDRGEWGDSVHDEEFDDEERDFDDGYDDDGGGDFDDDDYYDDDGGYSD